MKGRSEIVGWRHVLWGWEKTICSFQCRITSYRVHFTKAGDHTNANSICSMMAVRGVDTFSSVVKTHAEIRRDRLKILTPKVHVGVYM